MILVIGDAMIDRYIDGRIRRLAQEAPIPVFEPMGDWRDYPGGAANVAANIEALGEKAILIVGPQPIPTRKTRYVVGGNLIFRIDEETENPRIDPGSVIDAAARAMGGASAVVISDYGKGVVSEEVAAYAVQAAREWGIPLIVDPKPPRLMNCWRGATVVKLNRLEAESALGVAEGDDPCKLIGALRDIFGATHVVVTLGAGGMFIDSGREEWHAIPATAREVFDVVGAGDTVAAALAVGLSRGWVMLRSARFANAAAGLAVGKRGTSTVTMSEVNAVLGDAAF